jgi:hypothetical protein
MERYPGSFNGSVFRPQPAEQSPPKKLKKGRTKIVLVSAVLLFISLSVVMGLTYFFHRTHHFNPIPERIRQSTNVSLYYPAELPEGYAIKKDSFSLTSSVVTYYAVNSSSDKIIFSIQALPDKPDLEDFNKRVLQNAVPVVSDVGDATIGELQGRTVGSIVTKYSWVLITTSSDSVPKTAITATIKGFKAS